MSRYLPEIITTLIGLPVSGTIFFYGVGTLTPIPVSTLEMNENSASIKLENAGSGPMYIKKLRVFHNHIEYPSVVSMLESQPGYNKNFQIAAWSTSGELAKIIPLNSKWQENVEDIVENLKFSGVAVGCTDTFPTIQKLATSYFEVNF